MSKRNVILFFRDVVGRADVLDDLKVREKDYVLRAAASFGMPFSEDEFDSLIWNLEAHLARSRGEQFDAKFRLWDTMWGRYYLEYIALDLIPSFGVADVDTLIQWAENAVG